MVAQFDSISHNPGTPMVLGVGGAGEEEGLTTGEEEAGSTTGGEEAVVAVVVAIAVAVGVGAGAECGLVPLLLLKAKRSGSNVVLCSYL